MKIQASSGRSRAIYEHLNGKEKKSGVIITPGFLRLESAVLASQSSIDFALLSTQGVMNETEQRLSITDNFVASEIGFFILKVAAPGVNRGDVLRTNNNATIFSKAGEAAAMMNLYNGKLGITINSKTIIQNWDLMRHYRVGTAQKGVLTAASGTNNAYDQSQWDTASYGMYPLTPTVELRGSSNNKLTITLPASIDMSGTASVNYAVLYMRGFLKQNASNVVG